MTTETAGPRAASLPARLMAGNAGPVAIICLIILGVWYLMTPVMNANGIARAAGGDISGLAWSEYYRLAMSQDRPMLPAPHQIIAELWKTVFGFPPTAVRSLVYHSWVTLSSAFVGFAMGAVLGVGLAVLIVHAKTLQKSLLPWIISSQTVPILAVAPIIIVVLGSLGITGILPKAVISTYLCFFPVTIGMVKGLTSPEVMQLDLMRTYNASVSQTFWKLRWPAAVPYLFASLKVAVAIALVGAIVGELPTGAQAGLGARLLTGSYYGQMVQIWAALIMAAFLAAMLVVLVGVVERIVSKRMGARA
jgi:NitT/TauT family transport system permease protein